MNISRNALSRRPETGGAAMGNWHELCRIIMARLTLTGNEWLAATPKPDVAYTARRVEASIRECSAALQQLRRTLADEASRRHSLEQQLFEARTALSQARASLLDPLTNEKRTRYLAVQDCLTLLPKRRFFLERLELALTEMEPPRRALAVLFVELEFAAPLNDPAAAQHIVRVIAGRLNRGMRAENVASHLDGGEFACLVPGLPSREHVGEQAAKVYGIVSLPVTVGGMQIQPHPAIGIAMCPDDGCSADALLGNAAAAMGWAKRQKIGFAFSRVPTLY
jgi:diguanylate cyclase (GGDEF)-like protein